MGGATGAMGGAMGAVGATGAMGAVGAMGAAGGVVIEGKLPPRSDGCSTGMGLVPPPPPPIFELVKLAPRPREDMSGDCYKRKGMKPNKK